MYDRDQEEVPELQLARAADILTDDRRRGPTPRAGRDPPSAGVDLAHDGQYGDLLLTSALTTQSLLPLPWLTVLRTLCEPSTQPT